MRRTLVKGVAGDGAAGGGGGGKPWEELDVVVKEAICEAFAAADEEFIATSRSPEVCVPKGNVDGVRFALGVTVRGMLSIVTDFPSRNSIVLTILTVSVVLGSGLTGGVVNKGGDRKFKVEVEVCGYLIPCHLLDQTSNNGMGWDGMYSSDSARVIGRFPTLFEWFQ